MSTADINDKKGAVQFLARQRNMGLNCFERLTLLLSFLEQCRAAKFLRVLLLSAIKMISFERTAILLVFNIASNSSRSNYDFFIVSSLAIVKARMWMWMCLFLLGGQDSCGLLFTFLEEGRPRLSLITFISKRKGFFSPFTVSYFPFGFKGFCSLGNIASRVIRI